MNTYTGFGQKLVGSREAISYNLRSASAVDIISFGDSNSEEAFSSHAIYLSFTPLVNHVKYVSMAKRKSVWSFNISKDLGLT